MWIFGQVWFACLVGFVVGVGLDWLLRVRPLSRRLAELERELAVTSSAERPQPTRQAMSPAMSSGLSPEYPPTRTTSLSDELMARDRAEDDPFRASSLSDSLPELPVRRESHLDDPYRQAVEPPAQPAESPTLFTSAVPEPEPERADPTLEPPVTADPSQQYLSYLRSGETADDLAPEHLSNGQRHEPEDPDGDAAERGRLVLGDYQPEEPPPSRAEATSVMPFAEPEDESQHETGAFDLFATGAEPTEMVRRQPHHGDSIANAQPFQPEMGTELADSLPRSGQLTPIEEGGFQPFAKPQEHDESDQYRDDQYQSEQYEADQYRDDQYGYEPTYRSEYEQSGPDQADHQQGHEQAGYGESGHEEAGYEQGEPEDDESAEQTGPVSAETISALDVAARERHEQYERQDQQDQQDRPDQEPVSGGTQVMHPVAEHGDEYDEPDLPGPTPDSLIRSLGQTSGQEARDPEPEQVTQHMPPPGRNGSHTSAGMPSAGLPAGQEQAPASRSLFEPVIDPSKSADYSTHHEPTIRAMPVNPVRVRTGVPPDQPTRRTAPQARPEQPRPEQPRQAQQPEPPLPNGPFGPGSALPAPDGSAPSPRFRVKARTSSMVFHTESSPFYERLEPQVWFVSAEDAQRAGFTSWERPGRPAS